MKRILIYAEHDYQSDAVNLLETAGRIYGEESFESCALIVNAEGNSLSGYFDVLYRVSDDRIRLYDQKSMADLVAGLHREYGFDSILIPATPQGRMLAPRVAMKLKTGLVADVTEIGGSKEALELVRPAYSGRIMAGIHIKGEGPAMMTVRPGIFSYPRNRSVNTRVIEPEGLPAPSRGIRRIQRKEKPLEYDIRESDVLISGGGGVSKDFATLKPLAEALKGQISASRAVVDKGIVARTVQVGQSGKTVSPSLYIALGINGAIQHVEGLKNVDNIISVNINRNAPICSLSDIVVEGDAVTFINNLLERINKEKKDGTD